MRRSIVLLLIVGFIASFQFSTAQTTGHEQPEKKADGSAGGDGTKEEPKKGTEEHKPDKKHVHWTYDREGEDWGDLSPDFAACKNGTRQSPVDVRGPLKRSGGKLEFKYKPSPIKLVNNGHTIQFNYEKGSTVMIDGMEYELIQFHFHTPAENREDGIIFDMEIHFVHKNKDGGLGVIGVFVERGKEHQGLKTFWNSLPMKSGEEAAPSGTVLATDFFPRDRAHFSFDGSLTTPPCSEGVKWFLFRESTTASLEQIRRFNRIVPESARKFRPLNSREIQIRQE